MSTIHAVVAALTNPDAEPLVIAMAALSSAVALLTTLLVLIAVTL